MTRTSAATADLSNELANARITALYREHAREILGYALRRTVNPDDAADIVAETFLVAWRRLGDVPAGSGARPWLYGTARLVLANHDRSAHRRDRLTERLRTELRQQLPVRHTALAGGAVLEALEALGETDRELLTMIGWEELTPSEAARTLDISPLAARSRLHRARRRFRAELSKRRAANSQNTDMKVEEAR